MPNSLQTIPAVLSVNVSSHKGTIKSPVQEVTVTLQGIAEDAHAGAWHRQISLLAQEQIDTFAKEHGKNYLPGTFAENITTTGVDFSELRWGDLIEIGQVQMAITQFGKSCHGSKCAIFQEVGACVMPKQGIFCKVIKEGTIRAGDPLRIIPRSFDAYVITLSDRAATGQYEDKSGPLLEQLLVSYLTEKRWRIRCHREIIGDEAEGFRSLLTEIFAKEPALLFTTGGTGIGPRDITPEVLMPLLDKQLPGIMERVRFKYGESIPSAVLSRSFAGVKGKTLIYALPGSPRAVEQYWNELSLSIEHALHMLHELNGHG